MELPKSFELSVEDMQYDGDYLYGQDVGSVEIGIKEEPIYIHVDSDTDWPTVAPSVAGVLVAFIVAVLSVKVQRNQIRSNISNFRHQWITELRNCSSEYLQSLYSMAIHLETKEDYFRSEVHIEDYGRLIVLSTRFEMLLSRDDTHTKEILELDQKVMDAIDNYQKGDGFKPVVGDINALKALVRKEVERAWCDIKSDVGVSSSRDAKQSNLRRFWRMK